jgi:hypothetical protein
LPECRGDLPDDPVDRLADTNSDRVLVRARWFKRRKLAVEQVRRHEMTAAGGETSCDQSARPVEINQPHPRAVADDPRAILPLQRRAGDNAADAARLPQVDYPGDSGKPGRPVGIGQRMPALHLCHILRRVKPISLREFPLEPFRQALPDRRLTGARDAHDHGT